MKLRITATRPIDLGLDAEKEARLLSALKELVSGIPNINLISKPGVLNTLDLSIELMDYKHDLVNLVITLICELVGGKNTSGGSPFEGMTNKSDGTISFRFNLDHIGMFYFSLGRPSLIKEWLMPVIVHELTHLVDSPKSKRDVKRQEKAENKETSDKMISYFNQDSEVRGHLGQICFEKVDPLFVETNEPIRSVKQVIESILVDREYSLLFASLDESNQKKMIKGITTRYQDLSDNEGIRKKSSLVVMGIERSRRSMPCWDLEEEYLRRQK
jgi:hypothetical protein